MPFLACGDLALGATVNAFALGGEASIAADLLVMAEAISAGDLGLVAAFGFALALAVTVLALGGEASVTADLLIVTWTVPGGACLLIAIVGLAEGFPFSFDDLVLHSVFLSKPVCANCEVLN